MNKRDNQGQTALLCAASHGRNEICKDIIQKCDDQNAVDSKVRDRKVTLAGEKNHNFSIDCHE